MPLVICNPARQGNCPAVLCSMLKLSFSVVGSMLGFGLSALCLQPSELVTDTLLFRRCIPFFFGRSAFFLDLAFPFCKPSVVVINYGFCLTVRRSMRYNGTRHKTEIGATKRKKIRTVDFCDTLAAILRTAKAEQHKNRFKYGELYSLNYYSEVKEKDRTYYEVYSRRRRKQFPKATREAKRTSARLLDKVVGG